MHAPWRGAKINPSAPSVDIEADLVFLTAPFLNVVRPIATSCLGKSYASIGIQLVRMAVWVRDGARERGLRGLWRKMLDLPSAEQFERTRLHVGLALAFLLGSILGSVLYLRYGAPAMAMPCVVLLLVMALDISPAGSHAPATSL